MFALYHLTAASGTCQREYEVRYGQRGSEWKRGEIDIVVVESGEWDQCVVGLGQEQLHSMLGCTPCTTITGWALMSRGNREVLSARPTHARVRWTRAVCGDMVGIY